MQSTTDSAEGQLIDPTPFRTRRRPGGSTDVQLPGGWLLRHRVQPTNRNVLEVFDAGRDLVGLVASTGRASMSIDAAWRGCTDDADRGRRWWSLAMGHIDGGTDAPDTTVTFLGRPPDGRLRRTTVTPIVIDGLWIAMVPARRDVVTLHQGTRHYVQRILPTLRGCA
jgi:hypothetical protein